MPASLRMFGKASRMLSKRNEGKPQGKRRSAKISGGSAGFITAAPKKNYAAKPKKAKTLNSI